MKLKKKMIIISLLFVVLGGIMLNVLEYAYDIPIMFSFAVMVVLSAGSFAIYTQIQEAKS